MADFKLYFPEEEILEGVKFENDPNDKPTKFGLTLDDIHEYNLDVTGDGVIDWHDVQALTAPQAGLILKKLYWDFFLADQIENQSLGMYLVDGGLNQGRNLIAKYVQGIVGVTVDGEPGQHTLAAINNADASQLFADLKEKRIARYDTIVANNPSQKVFYNGWMNRVNAITFTT